MINLLSAQQKLRQINQEHLLNYWEKLSDCQKNELLLDIQQLDLTQFKVQQQLLHADSPVFGPITPLSHWHVIGQAADDQTGRQLITEGRVGALLIAGGQGSRLGFSGPKGLYPISKFKKKTLFQLFAEKTLKASVQAGFPLSLAVMTSAENDGVIRDYFAVEKNFGLTEEQITFFTQTNLPFLDAQGNAFLESPFHIAQGPDGNGSVFNAFVQAGIYAAWKLKGISHINVVLIDNPITDPFDAELVGFHHRNRADATIKAVFKNYPEEKVGVLADCEGHLEIREYSELSDQERHATDLDGNLVYRCANISQYCLDIDFISRVSAQPLPLHLAYKKAKYLSASGEVINPDEPNAWKFEKFIFDMLPFAKKSEVLVYPRENCFAPLKNSSGENSPETVQEAMMRCDREVFQKITGVEVYTKEFELAQDFYYPTEALKNKWKGQPLPDAFYIDP